MNSIDVAVKGRRLLRTKDVLKRVPFSRATLWRKVKEGTFPAPCRPGPNMTAWTDEQVEDYFDGLLEAREADHEAA